MDNGTTASFQDNSIHGEDAFLTRDLGNTACLDVVLDGVTHCEGAYASSFAAQLLRDAPIESFGDAIHVLEQANEILYQGGKGRNLLTTVLLALKLDDQLHIASLGDSPGYLVRDGLCQLITPELEQGLLPALVGGALGLREKLECWSRVIELKPKDRLVLTTDGLMNNLYVDELTQALCLASSSDDAVSRLLERMEGKKRTNMGRDDTYGAFHADDQTVIARFLK